MGMSCCKQSVHKRAIQVSLGKMSEQGGLSGVMGWGGQEGKVAVGMDAADEFGTWRVIDGQALGTDGNAAIVADLHCRALTPDIGPPGAARSGTQERAFSRKARCPRRW